MCGTVLATACCLSVASGAASRAAMVPAVTAVPTFHNIGVHVVFPAAPDPATAVTLAVRGPGDIAYRTVQPLCRLDATSFAGSAIDLQPGTPYSLRLTSAAFVADQVIPVTTRPDEFPAATGLVFHVALTGRDTNDGLSVESAFRTLARALTEVQPGTTILLHEGRYYEGDLDIPADRSGTAAAPVILANAPGATPVLDGTDPSFAPAWTLFDAARGVYRSPCVARPEYVYLNGEHLFRFGQLDDLRTSRWNQASGAYADGAHLYVRFPGGGPPGTNQVTIPRYATALYLEASHWQIRGMEVCHYGSQQDSKGIYLRDAHSNLVEHSFFHHTGAGVGLKAGSSFNTIQHCRFVESPVPTFSWAAVKAGEGNAAYETGAVYFYGSQDVCDGNVIRYNVMEDQFDGSHLYVDDPPVGLTRNLDFHDNVVTRCGDDGIETDGAGSNVRIYRNRFTDLLTGISLAPARVGPVYVFRNVVSQWHSVAGEGGEVYEGYPIKLNQSGGGITQWVFLYHNTFATDVPGQDGFLFKNFSEEDGWMHLASRNNIYAGTAYAMNCWQTPNPVDFDYDDLFTTRPDRLAFWSPVRFDTLAVFMAGTGLEAHGLAVNPQFVAAASGDYRLAVDSPLIDRGVALAGVNDGFAGEAPDIGAFEYRHRALGIDLFGERVQTTWEAITGQVYRLQWSADLSPGSWSNFPGSLISVTPVTSILDTNPPVQKRFYRLLQD